MVFATLAGSAVIAPAHKERDEPNEVMASFEVPALGVLAGARVGGMETAWTQVHAGIICDGQHCDIGSAASTDPTGTQGLGDDARPAGTGEGSSAAGGGPSMDQDGQQSASDSPDLTAALWLLREPMYVLAGTGSPPVHEPDSMGRESAPIPHGAVPPVAPPAGHTDWRTLIEQWDDWDVSTMLRIIDCESHGDANAVSPGGQNWGAYQINVVHGYSVAQMTDPVTSTAIAHDIWLSQSYQAWSCY